jgi:hypothetical protein
MKGLMVRATVILLHTVVLAASTATSPARSVTLRVGGRANATPSIAALGDIVAVAWGATTSGSSWRGAVTDVFVAVSRDGGRRFGTPRRVNDVAGDASLGGEQPPRVALVPGAGPEPSIVVVWTAKKPEGTRILVARSDDGGSSFGRTSAIAGGEAAGNRGWQSIAGDRDGQVVAVWLDHRETHGDTHKGGHDHSGSGAAKSDGVARAQLSKLYFSRLGSGTNRDDSQAIAAGVCYCCKTAVTTGSDGSVYAAWRHVYPGNVRDIAFTASRDGGRTFSAPLRVSDDHWVLDGCPENGPGMAVDSQDRVHVVWPTLVSGSTPDVEPTLELFYAVSNDGRTFAPRQRIPVEGVPRHAQIAAARDDSLILVWEEQTSDTRRIVMARAGGTRRGFSRRVVSDSGRAVYPAVAATPTASVIAWTNTAGDQSVIQVKRVEE